MRHSRQRSAITSRAGKRFSPSDVVKAINAQSAIIPAGDIKIGDLDYYVYSNSLIDAVDKINDIPTIVSFRNVYSKEVQDKVLANWVNYGYAPVAR